MLRFIGGPCERHHMDNGRLLKLLALFTTGAMLLILVFVWFMLGAV